MAGPLPRIVPLGDAAVLADFSDTLDLAVNARIQQLARVGKGRAWLCGVAQLSVCCRTLPQG